MGIAYNNTLQYDKAITYFQEIDRFCNERNPPTLHHFVVQPRRYLQHLGHLQQAKEAYYRVLAVDKSHHKVHWCLSTLYLLQGDFFNGWKKYEWRKKMPKFDSRTHGLLKDIPQWQGEKINGKTISIHSEQGFGDTVQFTRLIPLFLKKTGVKKIYFRTHTQLYELSKQLNDETCEVFPEGIAMSIISALIIKSD